MSSSKEETLKQKLIQAVQGHGACEQICNILLNDPELHELQEYANVISIRRLGFNDHGPVHMYQVAYNAIKMLTLIQKAGIQTNLEKEESGSFDDSLCSVFTAGILHDIGMTIGREKHEQMSCTLALPIINRILKQVFPGNLMRQTVIRSTIIEGIVGHMGTQRIHSLEAGLILMADGCDMTKGRARIPMILNTTPRIGDIHKYSANSIERVKIRKGENKPILIDVEMASDVGFFQIEEVLISKINASPAKPHVELYAGVTNQPRKKYL